MKIVVNRRHGLFSVSKAVFAELGMEWKGYGSLDNKSFGIEGQNYFAYRTHPQLIAAIEKIGEAAASGGCAKLRILEIPDGDEWEIDEDDGYEEVRLTGYSDYVF